jgi:hypothetical protein
METISKTMLIDSLSSMPEQVDVEAVIEQIILISKVERARQQIVDGQFSSHEAVKDRYMKWLE